MVCLLWLQYTQKQVHEESGRLYIEVHHLNPLSEQDGEQEVDPVTDMVCLCANCHRMIHRNRNHVLSIKELKQLILAKNPENDKDSLRILMDVIDEKPIAKILTNEEVTLTT